MFWNCKWCPSNFRHYLNDNRKWELLENNKAQTDYWYSLYIRPVIETFWLGSFSGIIYICLNQDRKVRNLLAYVFTMSVPNGVFLVKLCIVKCFSILVMLHWCTVRKETFFKWKMKKIITKCHYRNGHYRNKCSRCGNDIWS